MAAEVSSMVREVSGYKEEGEGKKDLVTRDLLGGGGEIDVGLQVPVGWERRLDLLSGKSRNQKSGGPDPVLCELHDLNLPPPQAPPSGGTVIPEESSSLDLALSGTAARAAPASAYRSVCTLEKVKSALERAERESRWRYRLPAADCGNSASPSSSTTSSSLKRRATEDGESAEAHESPSAPAGGMMAAGCPCCLLYVLISTADPRCPRCDSHVPVPAMKKKPRIDLNSSSSPHYY